MRTSGRQVGAMVAIALARIVMIPIGTQFVFTFAGAGGIAIGIRLVVVVIHELSVMETILIPTLELCMILSIGLVPVVLVVFVMTFKDGRTDKCCDRHARDGRARAIFLMTFVFA